jgi:hypothetical protein
MRRRAELSLATTGAAILVAAGVALVLLLSASGARAATLLYPDLKTLKPTDLQFATATINGTAHQVLRFSNTVWNAGEGPLELRAKTVTTTSGKKTRVSQRIYDDAGGYITRHAGDMVYHASHNHFHFQNFARYELWTRADYDNWLASGRTEGQAQRRGTKTTFCVMDTFIDPHGYVEQLPRTPSSAYYTQCGQSFQGISVGWGDRYLYDLPEQWIDLGTSSPPLLDGNYVLRSVADPTNRLYESSNKNDSRRESGRANEAVTFFSVEGGTITITN